MHASVPMAKNFCGFPPRVNEADTVDHLCLTQLQHLFRCCKPLELKQGGKALVRASLFHKEASKASTLCKFSKTLEKIADKFQTVLQDADSEYSLYDDSDNGDDDFLEDASGELEEDGDAADDSEVGSDGDDENGSEEDIDAATGTSGGSNTKDGGANAANAAGAVVSTE